MKVLVPGPIVKTLCTLSHLVLTCPRDWHHRYVHFTGEKTMAQGNRKFLNLPKFEL